MKGRIRALKLFVYSEWEINKVLPVVDRRRNKDKYDF